MKLTMLGTSHGVPSEIRYCSCYMIEVNGNIYLFDGIVKVTAIPVNHNYG